MHSWYNAHLPWASHSSSACFRGVAHRPLLGIDSSAGQPRLFSLTPPVLRVAPPPPQHPSQAMLPGGPVGQGWEG